jgi:hypothetical protein
MEPRKNETPSESSGEGQVEQPRLPEKKRRFQIVKLEERIAPGKGGTYYCGYHGNNGSQGKGQGCLK